ncbi:helix-turn-helix transcriptional regulator [Asanoa siamensis]|uniref:Transcriptional regulator n=1 Tax=Asanoa siamensis TaxID=926357 RepID=A0ABQ4CRZ5_9ACTN|nr:helix-turn-helix transcriptional regulator [Asanoa siamensis]GIF74057.1 transcriptional regulator [Asanoa siamensis]
MDVFLSDEARLRYEQLLSGESLDEHDEVVHELTTFGLVHRDSGTGSLTVAPPGTALRRMLAGRQRELLDALTRLDDQYAQLELLERRFPGSDGGAGETALARSAAEMAAHWHELTAYSTGPCYTLRTTSAPTPFEQRWAAARRLSHLTTPTRFRTVFSSDVLEQPTARAEAERLIGAGGQLRVHPLLPGELVLADHGAMLLVNGPREQLALVVRARGLLIALRHYFDLLWSRSVPFGRTPGDADPPSPAQSQVLRLAAAGLKDEAIARNLGRSTRWVRRHFEVLEERLGATNRLTLGIAAARRGWV